jgi:hypothetical protein
MKRLIISLTAVVVLTGCVGIKYTVQQVTPQGTNNITLSANRFIWSTGSYVATISTNGTGSLTVSKSSVDSVALGTIIQAVVSKAPVP